MPTAKRLQQKRVALIDATERSRKLIVDLLTGLGYQTQVQAGLAGSPTGFDLIILNLSSLGNSYTEAVTAFEGLACGDWSAPLLVVTDWRLSSRAHIRLTGLGARAVLSGEAAWTELPVCINSLLFSSLGSLTAYTRQFGGFPVQTTDGGRWEQGQAFAISQHGAFVRCDRPAPAGSRLNLRFVLPESTDALTVPVKVRWNNPSGEAHDGLTASGMGISFWPSVADETTELGHLLTPGQAPRNEA